MRLYNPQTDDFLTERSQIVDRLTAIALALLTTRSNRVTRVGSALGDDSIRLAKQVAAGDPGQGWTLKFLVRALWRSEVIA